MARVTDKRGSRAVTDQTVGLLSSVDWNALPADFGVKVLQLNGWVVATTTFVDEDKIFVSNKRCVIALHPDAWTTLGFDQQARGVLLLEAMGAWTFMGDAGIRRLLDCPGYLDAARAQEAANRPVVVDSLEALWQRASRLIVAASGLTTSPDRRQLALFTQQLTDLQREITEAEERVARVRALVTLAEEAVCTSV